MSRVYVRTMYNAGVAGWLAGWLDGWLIGRSAGHNAVFLIQFARAAGHVHDQLVHVLVKRKSNVGRIIYRRSVIKSI